jgi:hypothetical protein
MAIRFKRFSFGLANCDEADKTFTMHPDPEGHLMNISQPESWNCYTKIPLSRPDPSLKPSRFRVPLF